MKTSSLLSILNSAQKLLAHSQDPILSGLIADLLASRLAEVVNVIHTVELAKKDINVIRTVEVAKKNTPPPAVAVPASPVEEPKATEPKAEAPKAKRPYNRKPKKRQRMSEAEKAKARELIAAGHSTNKVAALLGRSPSGIYYATVAKRATKSGA